jgi:hypothetical protein
VGPVPTQDRDRSADQISDAELVTLSVMQALLGFTSEARWLRHARERLPHLFPYLPQQPGYNKRLRRLAGTLNWLTGMLARDASVWTDDVWVSRAGFDGDHQAAEVQVWRHHGSTRRSFGSARSG